MALRAAAWLVPVFTLGACSGAAPFGSPSAPSASPSEGVSSPASSSALPQSSGEIGGLPDLGLTNVKTETANARAATVGPAGGKVTATSSNGTTFTLTIPAGALDQDVQVGIYPVASLASLPDGASLTAGVQFVPDGLRLAVPATLAIGLPAGGDPTQLLGLSWAGDGQDVHAYPAVVSGQTATLDVYHFSGGGAGRVRTRAPSVCATQTDMEVLFGFDWNDYLNGVTNALRNFTNDLKTCYRDFVLPTLRPETTAPIDKDPAAGYAADLAYDFWWTTIAKLAVDEPGFTVSPELADSAPIAAAFLRNWFDSWDLKCATEPDNTPTVAVQDAITAITLPHEEAAAWGLVATNPNLDDRKLLHDLCVQVVIGPSRGYGGSQPGDTSAVHVPVGYSISGGAVRTDLDIEVVLTLEGAAQPFADTTVRNIEDSVDLTWPDGVDPLKIDISAILIHPNSPGYPTIISASDQVVKSACQHGDDTTLAAYGVYAAAFPIAQAPPTEGACSAPVTPAPVAGCPTSIPRCPDVAGPLILDQNASLFFQPVSGICQHSLVQYVVGHIANGLWSFETTNASSWAISGAGTLGPDLDPTHAFRVFRAGNAEGAAQLTASGVGGTATLNITVDSLTGFYLDASKTELIEVIPASAYGGALPAGSYAVGHRTGSSALSFDYLTPQGLSFHDSVASGGQSDLDLTVDQGGISGTIDGRSVSLSRTCNPIQGWE